MSFHVALALLAIVTVPVSIDLLSYATGVPVDATLPAVAELVGISILLPMVAGMISGWLFPAMARRISQPLEIFSVILIILLVILLLLPTYQMLFTMDIRSYVAIALMTIGALARRPFNGSGTSRRADDAGPRKRNQEHRAHPPDGIVFHLAG